MKRYRKQTAVILVLFGFLVFAENNQADGNWKKPASLSEYSVTITNSASIIVPENLQGRGVFIKNNSASGTVYLSFDGTNPTASNTRLKLTTVDDGSDWIYFDNFINEVRAIGDIASNEYVVIIERRRGHFGGGAAVPAPVDENDNLLLANGSDSLLLINGTDSLLLN